MSTATPLAAERPMLSIVPRDERIAAIQQRIDALDKVDTLLFTPTRERPSPEMCERGVWFLGWFDAHDNPMVVAVSSRQRVIHWKSWTDDQTYDEIRAELWDVLDKADPVG